MALAKCQIIYNFVIYKVGLQA